MLDVLITGGKVIDGTGLPWYIADIGVEGDRITAIGQLAQQPARQRIDAAGKVVAPGFIDAHVHGDLALFTDPLHEPAIRQGVTTYILGQDGVAMAPASPETLSYMKRYTAGFSGIHELPLRWSSMDEYLSLFDKRTALNVACLIPNGNVRMEAMGLETRLPRPDELEKMARMVREAMEQGAVGLSTGLDYIPSRYAEAEEIATLCKEIAPFGGVYVTHQRRYDADGVIESMNEVYRIGRDAGCPVHISHFNSRADIVLPKMDEGRRQGLDVTFDLYCYMAGSTILGMVALPPWVQEGGVAPTVKRLADPKVREQLKSWFAQPKTPLETIRIGYVANPSMRHFEGKTVAEAAESTNTKPGDFICDLLVASDMAVGCVVPHMGRNPGDIRALMRHPGMMAGSDGIYTGSHPHPRGCGCFARYLSHYIRTEPTWQLEEAIQHLSSHAARRFGLKDRGLLLENMAADIIVFDPDTIADRSTFDEGRKLATGMDSVLVNGTPVLVAGQRTTATPGRGLRRA